MSSEIEKEIFIKDIIEKKKNGKGVFGRKATRKNKTQYGIMFPSDYMSSKEKKKLNGEVNTKMIIPKNFKELKEMDKERIEKIIKQLREECGSQPEVCKRLGVSKTTLYLFLKNLGITMSTPRKRTKNKTNTEVVKTKEKEPKHKTITPPKDTTSIEERENESIIRFRKEGIGEILSLNLLTLGELFDKDKKYIIEVDIKEKTL